MLRKKVETWWMRASVLAAMTLVAACSSNSHSTSSGSPTGQLATVKVTIIPHTDYYMPLYAAQSLGIAKANGIQLQFVQVESGTALVSSIEAGASTFSATPIITAAQAIEHGVPLEFVGQQEPASAGFVLEAKAGSGITNVKQLAGKTICISSAGSESGVFAAWASAMYHLGAHLVPVGANGEEPSLLTGSSDACVESSPTSYQLLENKQAIQLIDFNKTAQLYGAWFTEKGYPESHSQITQAFLRTWYQAIARVQSDPNLGIQELETLDGETPALAKMSFDALYSHASTNGGVSASEIQQNYDVATAAGITGLPPVSQLTTSKFANVHG